MKKRTHYKVRFIVLTILFMFLATSVMVSFLPNSSNSVISPEDKSKKYEDNKKDDVDNNIEPIERPDLSAVGTDTWWDDAWRYRRLINVTNPYVNTGFTNYTTSLEFNYTKLFIEGKMNGDCSDIRVVQNDVLRKYYYELDYPEQDLVTVWFDVDLDIGLNDYEHTYLYFNGSGIESKDPDYYMESASNYTSDSLGWIRNGNFELDVVVGQKTPSIWGWEYSDDSPYSSTEDPSGSVNYQYNVTSMDIYQSRVSEGNWSYKWGDVDHYLEDDDTPTAAYNYEGTVYSYPFIVPTLSGTESTLKINVYRNIRFYNTLSNQLMAYFLRISENYDPVINNHNEIEVYENWKSIEKSGVYTWALNQLDEFTERNTRGSPWQTADGQLTGEIEIDVTAYQGRLVFLEFGTYGKEHASKTAFAQIDDIRFNYDLPTSLNIETQEKSAEVTFITKDDDGRIVPNAEISVIDEFGSIVDTQYSSEEDGSYTFTSVAYGTYNVTVNYTLIYSANEAVVYNSSEIPKDFLVDNLERIYELILNISTIDFEIVDLGGYPLNNYGYINISDAEGTPTLDILPLDDDGKATFRWFSKPMYYFQIYYNNTDYYPNPTPLNASYIYRDNYNKLPNGNKYQTHTFNVNETNTAPAGSQTYSVNQIIYTNGSTEMFGNKKIINFTLTLTEMEDKLTNVSIYYVDKDNKTGTLAHRIYFEEGYAVSEDQDIMIIDIMTVDNDKLSTEKREAYGLLIVVNGENSSGPCNGIIDVKIFETWNIYNKTILSKLNIRVLGNGNTISDAIVRIKSNSIITELGQIVTVNLTSSKPQDGHAFTPNNLPFWYLSGYAYNFSIAWEEYNTFNISGPDPDQWPFQPEKGIYVDWYNYTVLKYNFTLEFDLGLGVLEPEYFFTKFDNIVYDEAVIWGQNVNIGLIFNSTRDNWGIYDNITDLYGGSDYISVTIKEIGGDALFTLYMGDDANADDVFTLEFNSSILSAGFYGEFYSIIINGYKNTYDPPPEITTGPIYIAGKPTELSLHDYYSPTLQEITTKKISQYFGEPISITVKYYNDTNNPLMGALIGYNWINIGYDWTGFSADPINDGYYTLTLDTSIAETVGTKSIEITAKYENYTTEVITIYLRILERETTINGETGLVYESERVWVGDDEDFDYTYRDVTYGANIKIGDLDVYTYTWQELDEDGEPIEEESGTGNLIKNDYTYTLDFNTGDLDVGFYYLYITLQKENYEVRSALVYLEIELRIIDVSLDATNLVDDQATVVKGEDIEIEIELKDTTRDDEPLTDATVILTIGGKEYEFEEKEDGVYTYTFTTDEIDAFFTSQTLTGEITIEKDDFEDEVEDITLVITMEEIFPGVPTFYFILITTAIVGTVGSLVSYRVIQQARIPHFVKKVRKVKGAIKTRKKIPDISITSKEKMIKKLFGDEWSEYGLSLDDALGIVKKGKIKPDIKGPLKRNGGEL